MPSRKPILAGVLTAAVFAVAAPIVAPPAFAVPAPEVEYVYDTVVRRHFDFPNGDALGYGYRVCDEVTRGVPYAQVLGDVKRDVLPNDETAANYVVFNAVGILCPTQISRLRDSARGYQPPPA